VEKFIPFIAETEMEAENIFHSIETKEAGLKKFNEN